MKNTWICLFAFTLLPRMLHAAAADYFGIHIVDDETHRGVPLVQLELTDHQRLYTDSNGYVAFSEPGLMNRDVWFGVTSWGYDGPKGAFGTVGTALKTTPGTIAEIKVHRENIAERLYRQTGYGIYRDTILLGMKPPIEEGLLNGQVMGQDTVETAVYRGKMIWMWGDTDRPGFPLGNFHTSGATSAPPGQLDADRGIDFSYVTDPKSGFCRPMVTVGRDVGNPIWVDGFMVTHDEKSQEKLLARYTITQDMRNIEQGLTLFNDEKQQLEAFKKFPDGPKPNVIPTDHPVRVQADGKEYYLFVGPESIGRVRNDFAHITDLSQYEAFTCVKQWSASPNEQPAFDRDGQGHLHWSWQQNVRPIGAKQFAKWVKQGWVKPEESPFQFRDADTGKAITVANGSVAWNPYLKLWTYVFGQLGGESNLGEIWFAVARSPEGPWTDARKMATHAKKNDNNDFYNPMQHPELMNENGRFIYFEGTFVTTFSGNPAPTPLYDYNNIMYRLDVSNPRLKLPDPPAGWSETKPARED